jgi:hypothetical protein
LAELKNKQLPTFGTNQERRDRLRKFHGISPSDFASGAQVDLPGIGGGAGGNFNAN